MYIHIERYVYTYIYIYIYIYITFSGNRMSRSPPAA